MRVQLHTCRTLMKFSNASFREWLNCSLELNALVKILSNFSLRTSKS